MASLDFFKLRPRFLGLRSLSDKGVEIAGGRKDIYPNLGLAADEFKRSRHSDGPSEVLATDLDVNDAGLAGSCLHSFRVYRSQARSEDVACRCPPNTRLAPGLDTLYPGTACPLPNPPSSGS
jgi:hypothetical protein